MASATAGENGAKTKKKQKRKAKRGKAGSASRMAARLAEQDAELDSQGALYSAADLQGLKLQHSAEAFREGENVVLTLKDRGVLDGSDDELVNVNLAEADARVDKAKTLARAKATKYSDAAGEGTNYCACVPQPRSAVTLCGLLICGSQAWCTGTL